MVHFCFSKGRISFSCNLESDDSTNAGCTALRSSSVIVEFQCAHACHYFMGTQLHFSNPQAYHDIYNSRNRWDKEASLYHSFGEDRSSFGFLSYAEAKPRKDILSPLFSPRTISNMQGLVQEKVGYHWSHWSSHVCAQTRANSQALRLITFAKDSAIWKAKPWTSILAFAVSQWTS